MEKGELILLIVNIIISIILTNLGAFIWTENKIISIITILLGFVLIYF